MTAGLETGSGVAGRALDFSKLQNSFNLSKSGLEFDLLKAKYGEDAAEGDLWSTILSSGLGALGTAAGMYAGGSTGATLLGSATGGVLEN